MAKKLSIWDFIHIIIIISLTTFNPPLKQWCHNRLQFKHYEINILWIVYPLELVHLTLQPPKWLVYNACAKVFHKITRAKDFQTLHHDYFGE
jgi:hypothetical protein